MSEIAETFVRKLQKESGWEQYVHDYLSSQEHQSVSTKYSRDASALRAEDMLFHASEALDLAQAIKQLSLTLPRIPLIASVSTGEFNAFATLAPDGYPVILLESRLHALCGYLALSCADLVLAGPEWNFQRACYVIFTAALHAAFPAVPIEPRKILSLSNYQYEWDRFDYSVQVSGCFVRFVIAHELAHHILGHMNQTELLRIPGPSGTIGIRVFSREQKEELDADRLGYQIFLCDLTRRFGVSVQESEMWYSALPLVVLEFFDVIQSFANAQPNTHPMPRDRIDNLLPIYKEYAGGNGESDYKFVASVMKEVVPQTLDRLKHRVAAND